MRGKTGTTLSVKRLTCLVILHIGSHAMLKKISFLYLVFFVAVSNVYASFGYVLPKRENPFGGTVYTEAFDQKAIWEKYPHVLEHEKLGFLLKKEEENEEEDELAKYNSELHAPNDWFSCLWPYLKFNCERQYERIPQELEYKEEKEKLDKELLLAFLKVRKRDAERPIYEEWRGTTVFASVASCLIGGACYTPGVPANLAMNYTLYALWNQCANAAYRTSMIRQLIANFSGDPLLKSEARYALKKRFVPKELWERIETGFEDARDNTRNRAAHISLLRTVFKLRKEKSKSFLLESPDPRISKLQFNFDRLNTAVDSVMLRSFQDGKKRRNLSLLIKTALWQHMLGSDGRRSVPQNLLIEGQSGSGKTSLVEQISDKVQIPVIHVNVGAVIRHADFFGSPESPGKLLEAIVSTKVNHAILDLDEVGNMYNNPEFTPSLKTLLEPELGVFAPEYLKPYTFKVNTYLWWASSNTGIQGNDGADFVSENEIMDILFGTVEEKEPVKQEEPKLIQAPIQQITSLGTRFSRAEMPDRNPEDMKDLANQKVALLFENPVYLSNREAVDRRDLRKLDAVISKCKNPRELNKYIPLWFTYINEKKMREPLNSIQSL